MADTVRVLTLLDDADQTVVHLTCLSDGTGETGVAKVVKATVAPVQGGTQPAALNIAAVRWAIQGFTSITFQWSHATPDTALRLCGSGYEDFIGPGTIRPGANTPALPDPRSAGGTGDIILSSNGAAAGATYDVTLWLRKAAS